MSSAVEILLEVVEKKYLVEREYRISKREEIWRRTSYRK